MRVVDRGDLFAHPTCDGSLAFIEGSDALTNNFAFGRITSSLDPVLDPLRHVARQSYAHLLGAAHDPTPCCICIIAGNRIESYSPLRRNYPTIACGTKRDLFPVMRDLSSRMPIPAACSPMTQLPITA